MAKGDDLWFTGPAKLLELAERGLEVLYQNTKRAKDALLERWDARRAIGKKKRAQTKELFDKGERDTADAMTASYLMGRKETKNPDRAKERLREISERDMGRDTQIDR